VSDTDELAAGEQRVAWLRIAAIVLIVANERLPHPHPERAAFDVAAVAAFSYAVAMLLYPSLRSPSRRTILASTAADILAITALAYLSGGAYSDARLAYFVIPIAVAFRFGWRPTLLSTAVVMLAYDIQAAASHPGPGVKEATEFIVVQTGYLLWIGVAATLFSGLLAGRTRRLAQLARGRRQLLAEVMTAEERERRELAEELHDHAIQNLLAARQDLEDAAKATSSDALDRARSALTDTVADLRGAVAELHPHVRAQAGLEPALRAAADRASRRAGFDIDLYVDYPERHPDEGVLLGAAREFLRNAAAHARASTVTLSLVDEGDVTVLRVTDDGVGFDVGAVDQYVAGAHIGLLSQRERIEASGGRFEISSAPGVGTEVVARLPRRTAPPS
jgi:two-component system, NarL family, sensor kinase